MQGTLDVSKLHSSDVCHVDKEGHTLLILAAKHGHDNLVQHLVRMEKCPLDYRQMKVGGHDCGKEEGGEGEGDREGGGGGGEKGGRLN